MTRQIKICNEDSNGGREIRLSGLVSNLLLLILSVVGATALTVGILSWRAVAAEGDIKDLRSRQTTVERNQVVLDANQRQLLRDSDWAQTKLDALLINAGVTEIPTRPALPDTAIESPPQ